MLELFETGPRQGGVALGEGTLSTLARVRARELYTGKSKRVCLNMLSNSKCHSESARIYQRIMGRNLALVPSPVPSGLHPPPSPYIVRPFADCVPYVRLLILQN
jgi:hypothetical protein